MNTETLYKHTKNIDVVFGPTSIMEQDDSLLVQGFWYNISTGKVIRIDLDKIIIMNDDLENWKVYEHESESN